MCTMAVMLKIVVFVLGVVYCRTFSSHCKMCVGHLGVFNCKTTFSGCVLIRREKNMREIQLFSCNIPIRIVPIRWSLQNTVIRDRNNKICKGEYYLFPSTPPSFFKTCMTTHRGEKTDMFWVFLLWNVFLHCTI
jgi:hypothetical protein